MELSLNDIKLFILLFNDELIGSGVKLIPLVVSNGKHKVDCDRCLSHVFSEKEFASFESRWKNEQNYFQTESEGKITKERFSTDFIAKATSLMAATCVYHDCIPKFTSRTCGEMERLAVLLTREQIEIFYSQHKHIIIKGGFGCGKTIVAAAILEKICQTLQKYEKLFFICYDTRSALISHMTKDEKGSKNSKTTLIHNKEGLNLSVIIKDILEKKEIEEKVNFVVDEYDGEDLDESEAETLNNMFTNNVSLKDASIVMIAQPIEKERIINNTLRKTNMFHLLETMKVYKLSLVMRNSTEIHNLVVATREILSKKEIVYVHEEYKADLEKKYSQAKFIKKPAERDQVVTEKTLVKSSIRKKDLPKNPEEVTKLRIDEAQAIAGHRTVAADGRSKTVSKFTYAEANETGHDIYTEKPTLFEIEDGPEFQKILNLIAIFEKLNIRKKEHVVLHFDTNNEIPSTLKFIFEHHFKTHKRVTNKYEELTSPKKSILVCSFLTFRGLEHPEITVVIDRDIYFLQPYLVETLARCTSNLSVIILQNNETFNKVSEEWKSKQLVNKWKIECTKNAQKDDFTFNFKNDETIHMTFKHKYYKELEEVFNGISTIRDEIMESEMKLKAKTCIKQNR